VTAALVRVTGDLGLAEEVVQEALVSALTTWPTRGIPNRPEAWVMTTARHLAIDRIRRRRRFHDRQAVLAALARERAWTDPDDALSAYPDDRLPLLFTCCHPVLTMPARVALTLRVVAGLTSDELARAFLSSRSTMQQRLVRAKKAIQAAGVPFVIPDVAERAERLESVLAVVYLLFSEGYGPTSGEHGVRVDLAEEAIRLARLLHQLCPDDQEVTGLLALLLLQHARADARFADGEVVLLEDQDRTRWDAAAIGEGADLAAKAVTRHAGPYALQAAIAAVHAEATTYAATDWPQIAGLYRVLLGVQPGPIVALNHAVAVGMAQGPTVGLARMADLERPLAKHHLFHCARAALSLRTGRLTDARTAYTTALALVGNAPERRFIERRLAALAS
jgi:RNA polymerase sigma-70 factor (ECF subfamily)